MLPSLHTIPLLDSRNHTQLNATTSPSSGALGPALAIQRASRAVHEPALPLLQQRVGGPPVDPIPDVGVCWEGRGVASWRHEALTGGAVVMGQQCQQCMRLTLHGSNACGSPCTATEP